MGKKLASESVVERLEVRVEVIEEASVVMKFAAHLMGFVVKVDWYPERTVVK